MATIALLYEQTARRFGVLAESYDRGLEPRRDSKGPIFFNKETQTYDWRLRELYLRFTKKTTRELTELVNKALETDQPDLVKIIKLLPYWAQSKLTEIVYGVSHPDKYFKARYQIKLMRENMQTSPT